MRIEARGHWLHDENRPLAVCLGVHKEELARGLAAMQRVLLLVEEGFRENWPPDLIDDLREAAHDARTDLEAKDAKTDTQHAETMASLAERSTPGR